MGSASPLNADPSPQLPEREVTSTPNADRHDCVAWPGRRFRGEGEADQAGRWDVSCHSIASMRTAIGWGAS